MAKICRNIIFRTKESGNLAFLNSKNELFFREIKNGRLMSEAELLIPSCVDFDGLTDEDGNVHILGADKDGNLIYLKKIKEQWLRATILKNTRAENLFMFENRGKANLFFEESGTFKHLNFLDEQKEPYEVCRLYRQDTSFIVKDRSGNFLTFYQDKECGKLTMRQFFYEKDKWDEPEEISDTSEISCLFALSNENGVFVCYKERDELKFEKIGDKTSKKSLTRRHREGAQSPFIVNTGKGLKLCWIDKKILYSSLMSFEDNKWQRLETEEVDENGFADVFKVCSNISEENKYVIGCLKNDRIEILGDEKEVHKTEIKDITTNEPNEGNRMEYSYQFNLEQLIYKMDLLAEKTEKIEEKIDEIKNIQLAERQKKAVKLGKRKNLCKTNKK